MALHLQARGCVLSKHSTQTINLISASKYDTILGVRLVVVIGLILIWPWLILLGSEEYKKQQNSMSRLLCSNSQIKFESPQPKMSSQSPPLYLDTAFEVAWKLTQNLKKIPRRTPKRRRSRPSPSPTPSPLRRPLRSRGRPLCRNGDAFHNLVTRSQAGLCKSPTFLEPSSFWGGTSLQRNLNVNWNLPHVHLLLSRRRHRIQGWSYLLGRRFSECLLQREEGRKGREWKFQH